MNLYEAFIDEMQKTAEEKKKPSVLKHMLAGALGGTALGAAAAFGPRRAWKRLSAISRKVNRGAYTFGEPGGKVSKNISSGRKESDELVHKGIQAAKGGLVGAGGLAGGTVGGLTGLIRRAKAGDDNKE